MTPAESTSAARRAWLRSAALPALLLALLAVAGCKKAPERALAGAAPRRCVIHLHGKGQHGAAPEVRDGLLHLRPEGNGAGWGGRQWLYFPEDRYAEVRAIVGAAIAQAGCAQAIVHGFSNGASAAARLYCRAESFGGVVVGTIVDDPVPDHGVEGCVPAPGERLRLYWTSALREATEGRSCASLDWTCEGGSLIGIEEYARLLGTLPAPSTQTGHRETERPAELLQWWSH